MTKNWGYGRAGKYQRRPRGYSDMDPVEQAEMMEALQQAEDKVAEQEKDLMMAMVISEGYERDIQSYKSAIRVMSCVIGLLAGAVVTLTWVAFQWVM